MSREGLDVDAFLKLVEKGMIADAMLLVNPTNVKDAHRSTKRGVISMVCSSHLIGDDPDLVATLVRLGAPIIDPDKGVVWLQPIHYTAISDKPKVARLLLDLGVPVDFSSNGEIEFTPLRWACDNGNGAPNLRCAKVFIDAGATITIMKESPPIYFSNKEGLLPNCLVDFIATRTERRLVCIIVLGFHRCRSKIIGSRNGKDILRMIARCVWETRGNKDAITENVE